MAVKHILALLRGIGDEGHVASGAMALAQRLKAHVTATSVLSDATMYIDPSNVALSGTYYAELQQVMDREAAQRHERARATFDQAANNAKIPLTDLPDAQEASGRWVDATRLHGPAAVQIGRIVDLMVTGRPGTDLQALEDVEDAMFVARRPVLILPKKAGSIGQNVVVAWNGSSEAAAAARSAVDLLEPSSKVTIIQIGEIKQGGTPAAYLAGYLAWHGFKAEVKQLPEQPKSTAQLIMTTAASLGADVLVMGAFSHSRLRETILGGVTTHMLRECDMPVLMGH